MMNDRKRSVSFDFEQNKTLVYEVEEFEPEDIWYIGDDYVNMKAQSRMDAKDFRRRGFGTLLRDSFSSPHPHVQEYINAYAQYEQSQSRRGLERNLCRQHGEERSEMKDRARQSVLIHQRRLRREGLKADDVAIKLGSMYREVTRCAATFARRLAMADQLVATEGQDSLPAERLLDMEGVDFRNQGSGRPKMERRMSNCSVTSTNSYDSTRNAMNLRHLPPRKPKRCPGSPATPSEEFYAAIA